MLRVNSAPPTRSRKTKDPCPACALHKSLCICAQMPRLNLRTYLTLVIHAKELKRTTNTGRLAVRALVQSEILVRGLEPLDLTANLKTGYRPLLFFPVEGARELTPELVAESPLPIQLIVPDGNWRQASKVAIRHPEIAHVERVMISSRNTGSQHLRQEHTPEGMSTLQAIAQALRRTEDEAAYQALEDLYQAKLRATLKGRGAGPTSGATFVRDDSVPL
jgi:DTW domain-containing protein YfiP